MFIKKEHCCLGLTGPSDAEFLEFAACGMQYSFFINTLSLASDRRLQKTPIHTNIRPRNKSARIRTRQKHCRPHQFLWHAKAIHRRVRENFSGALCRRTVFFIEQTPVLLGGEKTGRNLVDAHPLGGPLAREKLRQADYGGFSR